MCGKVTGILILINEQNEMLKRSKGNGHDIW